MFLKQLLDNMMNGLFVFPQSHLWKSRKAEKTKKNKKNTQKAFRAFSLLPIKSESLSRKMSLLLYDETHLETFNLAAPHARVQAFQTESRINFHTNSHTRSLCDKRDVQREKISSDCLFSSKVS